MRPRAAGAAAWLACVGGAVATIDRAAVVHRHNVQYASNALDPVNTQFTALTVGNGELGFSADATGLQSLNQSYHTPQFPLLTLSNWGWHAPDPARTGVRTPLFRADGSLAYVYENVTLASADARPRKGNRTVPYQFNCPDYNDAAVCNYLHTFPARVNLGQLGFVVRDAATAPVAYTQLDPARLSALSQQLNMWTGTLASNWSYGDGGSEVAPAPVRVVTVVDGNGTDTVAVRYAAPATLKLGVRLAFSGLALTGAADGGWDPAQSFPHSTVVLGNATTATGGRIDLERRNGEHDTYAVSCEFDSSTAAHPARVVQTGPHAFVVATSPVSPAAPSADDARTTATTTDDGGGDDGSITVDVSCRFAVTCCVGPAPPAPQGHLAAATVPGFAQSRASAEAAWRAFWMGGAMVDIAGATSDPRAVELERRTVQSLYLMRSQESGSVAPQESGLLYNSWTGKHHNEMRFWHQNWMPLWGRPELLARSDEWFRTRLSNATSAASLQGYNGARWGKMLGESNMFGRGAGPNAVLYWESPNNINPGLVWHQPHVIYMSELEYRAAATPAAKQAVLDRMGDVVLTTAAFLADFPERRLGTGTNGTHLDIGPPLVSASEGEGPYDVWNPTYELTQFNFSLDIANAWRERLGLGRDPQWDAVRMALAPLPVTTDPSGTPTYNRHQNCLPSVFANETQHCSGHSSHPALTGALGCLPGDRYGVNREIMNNTLHEVLKVWSWTHCWGWDQPMVAMTATRLNQPEVAVNTLLMNVSTNSYLPTGYNHPAPRGQISAYLPGNGGTLMAVGLMAGGWEGAPAAGTRTGSAGSAGGAGRAGAGAPGFPPGWEVQAEGFTPFF